MPGVTHSALSMLRNLHPLHRWVAQWHFKEKEAMKLCNYHRNLKKINCKARIGSQSFWLQDLPYTMCCLCEETPPLRHPHLLVYGVQFSGTLPHGSKNTPPNSSDLLCQIRCCRTGDTNSNPLSMPLTSTPSYLPYSPHCTLSPLPDSNIYFLYFVYSPGHFILLSKIYLIILTFYWHPMFLKK